MAGFQSWCSYWSFERAVRRDFRYVRSVESEKFLDTVLATAVARKVILKEQLIFWRAQLGCRLRKEGQGDEVFEPPEYPHSPHRMKPLRDRASEGRANPKGIPYLYLATKEETAISEVRPWIGSFISLAPIQA